MAVQQTSLLAFSQIHNDLGPRQAEVADCISEHGPMDNKAIARKLDWQINSVTPRVLELRNKNLVELDRTDVGSDGRRVMLWRTKA